MRQLLALSDLGIDDAEGRRRAEAAVADGSRRRRPASAGSRRRAATRIRASLPNAPVVREVPRSARRVVATLGAIAIGNAALHLGAGRRTKEDAIDHAVGIVCLAKRGDAVEAGEPLAEVHARDEAAAEQAAAEVLAAYAVGDRAAA